METQEVTLHNELKHKSIFLRDFTTAAQMLWQVLRQVLRRCFGSCCAGASTGAAQMFRQVLHRCFGRCCDRAVSGVWRVGIGVVWNAGIRGNGWCGG